jgi:hypothetical protein
MKRTISPRALVALLIVAAIAVYVVACTRNGEEPPVTDETPPVQESDAAIEEFEKRRVEYEESLAKMEVPALSREMVKDSQARTEPFNSPAARDIERRAQELRDRQQPVEPLAKALAATLTVADASSHIGMLTVYEISKPTYYALKPEFRYQVLMDALSKAEVMNAWGVPHMFLTQPAAEAIICEGPAIERYLYPVLDVNTETRVFGSSEVERYKPGDPHHYQVKDYALALIFAVRGDRSFEIPGTREGRDGYIERIRKEAASGGRAAPPSRDVASRGPTLPNCEPRGDATQTPTQNAPAAQAAQTARK